MNVHNPMTSVSVGSPIDTSPAACRTRRERNAIRFFDMETPLLFAHRYWQLVRLALADYHRVASEQGDRGEAFDVLDQAIQEALEMGDDLRSFYYGEDEAEGAEVSA